MTIMDNGMKEYCILWCIENYSYCWHKNGEALTSPVFIAEGLDSTAWCLRVYPRGNGEKAKGYISLFLQKSSVEDWPKEFPLEFELAFLAVDGSSLISRKSKYSFKVGLGHGYSKFLLLEDVLVRRKTEYLPGDTLRVRCRMWKSVENLQLVTQIMIRTRIAFEKITFFHVAESFSALVQNQKTVQIKTVTEENRVISSNIYFTLDDSCEGTIFVEITPPDAKLILSKFKICLLGATGIMKKCAEADNRANATKRNIGKLSLNLTRKALLNKKYEYLPEDILSLLCECEFSTGEAYNIIEETLLEMPSLTFNQINATHQNTTFPSALEDFKSLYNCQLLTDIELKTETKSFSAHKNVLCARSPVFKAMLTNDMKERNTDCIIIDDLENDTLEKLLLFLYSDHLSDLRWETAIKLYYGADKYEIMKLKMLCSDFLVNNLDTFTATELLILADTHNDCDLKNVVEDFILLHEDQVFGSDEWEKLIETNPQLVIKTMHLKYRRNKTIQK